jgi:hypothetical protein
MELQFHPGPARKLHAQVSCQNKYVKLVHLVGFIIKKFVTIHGHMNVKKKDLSMYHESKLVTLFC